jgi:hypothetical protein
MGIVRLGHFVLPRSLQPASETLRQIYSGHWRHRSKSHAVKPRALNQSQHLLPSLGLAAPAGVIGARQQGFSSGANMQITAVRVRLSSEDVLADLYL